MEQVKALDALEQFVALSKAATSPRAAADVIRQATSHPNTFLFTELLEAPQIQALSSQPDFAPHLALLRIFSYGTYTDYTSAQGLPPLNEAQTLKLRQLSILTHARDHASLTYSSLIQKLGLSSARELEDTVVSAVYAGLVQAKLDPAHQQVQVTSIAPLRDLAPGSVPSLLTALREWSGRCESTLDELEAQVAAIRQDVAQRAAERRAWDERMHRLVEEEKAKAMAGGHDGVAGGGGGGGGGGGHGRRHMVSGSHGAAHHQHSRFGKRGSSLMDATGAGALDDEAMDVDDEEDVVTDGKKRASRRKL